MYRPTGLDRDSYISGVRPSGKYGASHDVNARRDNLPNNVFDYVAEGVHREERMRQLEEDKRARIRLQIANGKGGKKMVGGGAGDAARSSEQQLAEIASVADRHEALAALYAKEREEWDKKLAARGLSLQS